MQNKLRKIIAVIAVLALAASLAACGQPKGDPSTATDATVPSDTAAATTEPEATLPSATDADAASETATLLQAYYEANYNPANSGRGIRDLNGDGQDEMLVATYMESPTNMLMDYTLIYFRVIDGAVTEADRFSGSGAETNGFPPASETVADSSQSSGAPNGAEELTVHISDSGYIACLFYNMVDNWNVSYLVLSVKNEKLTVEQHLLDPGYTSGLGLYTYDSYYGGESGPEKLFATESSDADADSRYDSYWTALEETLGGYGFTFEPYRETGDREGFKQKGQVATDGTELLLDFRNFKTS